MKKSKIISATAAALLAVAPIGVAPFASAATNTTETSNTTVSDQPQFSVTYKQDGKEITADPNNQIFQVAVGSKFDPIKILGSNGDTFTITAGDAKITVDQNNVDTSKPGSFSTVKLTATNSKGKQTTISYEVLVTPAAGGYTLNVTPNYNTPGYNIFSDTQYPEVGTYIPQGTKIYVSNKTMIVYGTSYTKVSMTSQADADGSNDDGGLWVLTKALANSTPAPETVTKTVMHKALVYDNSGSSKVRTIAAYTKVKVNKETKIIDGTEYYQIANKPDFIKASNVDGTKRTLKHNAYVYATSTKRANKVTLKKGTKITTYGGSYKFKNGKRYYRIEGATKTKKMYVKVANFK